MAARAATNSGSPRLCGGEYSSSSRTWPAGNPTAAANSSIVGSRPSRACRVPCVARSRTQRRARPARSPTPPNRVIACSATLIRIHGSANVANRVPRVWSKRRAASSRPRTPSCSSSSASRPERRATGLVTKVTSRRLAATSRVYAAAPRSCRVASSSSDAPGGRPCPSRACRASRPASIVRDRVVSSSAVRRSSSKVIVMGSTLARGGCWPPEGRPRPGVSRELPGGSAAGGGRVTRRRGPPLGAAAARPRAPTA